MNTPFGELNPKVVDEFDRGGGKYIRESREMMMLAIFRQYLDAEVKALTPSWQIWESMLRVIARIMVEACAGASIHSLVRHGERNVDVIAHDMLGFLSQHVDKALAEYRHLCATGQFLDKGTNT